MAYQKVGYADSNGSWNVLKVDSDGAITVNEVIGSVILDVGDVEIGAVEIKDDNTGSGLDVVSTGIPSTYVGAQLASGAAEIGSAHITNIESGTIDTVSAVTSVTDVAAGSIRLEAGTAVVGSAHVTNIDAGIITTVSTVSSVTDVAAGSIQLQPSTDEVGSAHITNVDAGTIDIVTSLTAGSVQLQTGDDVVGSVYTIPLPTGSVHAFEGALEVGAIWLDAITPLIDFSISTGVEAGSVIIFART